MVCHMTESVEKTFSCVCVCVCVCVCERVRALESVYEFVCVCVCVCDQCALEYVHARAFTSAHARVRSFASICMRKTLTATSEDSYVCVYTNNRRTSYMYRRARCQWQTRCLCCTLCSYYGPVYHTIVRRSRGFVLLSWLHNAPATNSCISGTYLLRQL